MNRRNFLRMLGSIGAVASTNPVHFLAPPSGWHRTDGGLLTFANDPTGSTWASKTPEEIMADINEILKQSVEAPWWENLTIGLPKYSRMLDDNGFRCPMTGLMVESDETLRKRILSNV